MLRLVYGGEMKIFEDEKKGKIAKIIPKAHIF